MSAFIDYITKDGNIYVLLEDLKINSELNQDMEQFVEMLETIADLEGYMGVENSSDLDALALLEAFAPNMLAEDLQTMFEQPLLRVHSKR